MSEINPLLIKHIEEEESFIKRIIYKTNWKLILSATGLSIIGFIMIYSATLNTGKAEIFVSKQLFALIFGIILMIIFSLLNYQIYHAYYKYSYILGIVLLLIVLILGTRFRATRAWLDFNIITIQPSEIVKILFIIFLAGYFDQNWEKNNTFRKILIAIILSIITIILIMLQPDLSNAILYFPIIISIFFLAGVDKTFLITSLLYLFITSNLFLLRIYFSLSDMLLFPSWVSKFYLALSGSWKELIFIISFIFLILLIIWWVFKNLRFHIPNYYLIISITLILSSFISAIALNKFVKPYQQKRIIAFINPNVAPADAGYQVIQTRIAIGSGRLFGKGLFQGTQTQLGFVPEKHTDFIFSLIGEEFGFMGTSFVVLLFTLIILQGINIMLTSRDSFGSLLACGITSLFSFYFLVNIGMCLGIMPVIGLPLPFVSYGGSNLVSAFISIGILNSIHLRKFIY